MYILILTLPLTNGFLGFFTIYLGRVNNIILNILLMSFCWVLSLFIFYEIVLSQSLVFIDLYQWLLVDIFSIKFGLIFDPLSSVMLLVICTISRLVHIYSIDYMSHDPYLPRSMSYLSLFTFPMILLVTSNNFVQLFIGWEGVGLCSYLLINFWFTRIAANKAAIKAMLMIE